MLEVDILGTDYDKVVSDDLTDLEDKLSPFLVTGLLDSHSDLQGRVGYANGTLQGQVYYKLTDDGRRAVETGPAVKATDDIGVDEARELYWDEFFDQCEELSRAEPDDPHCIGTIALPVHMSLKGDGEKDFDLPESV